MTRLTVPSLSGQPSAFRPLSGPSRIGSTGALSVVAMLAVSAAANAQQSTQAVPQLPSVPVPAAQQAATAPVAVTPGQVVIQPVEVTAPKQPVAVKPKPAPVQPSQQQAVAPRPAIAPTTALAAPPAPVPIISPPAIPALAQTQTAPGLPAQAAGQPVTTIDRDRLSETRAFSVGDVLQESPGISVKQGNGPRDMGVSIRGSNARNGFGVRNIQVFEDGFPVTQPDGLSRTDLTDPKAYGGIDVWRGPSSALFGNYATGGAINFRTRAGGEINGFETGVDFGSFNYLNSWMALGGKSGAFEYSLYASDARSDGHLDWNAFNTQTVNFLGTYTPSTSDKVTVKFIRNELETNLAVRESLNQFNANPFQRGCATATAASIAAGCGTVSVFANGFNGAKVNLTAAQAGLQRTDQRTILGARWEHKFNDTTDWQIQAVVDDRNINQPTGATSAVGDFISRNWSSQLRHRYDLFGMSATHMMGAYLNTLPSNSNTFNVMPGGNATLGRLASNTTGSTENASARIREEIKATDKLMIVGGFSVEQTRVDGISTAYTYGNASGNPTATTKIQAERKFDNTAWELGAVYQPNSAWTLRSRVASAYGTPQIGNLFVTSAGVAGNNTNLQSQTNLGYDIGFDFTPTKAFKVSVTGFYEFFENELVSQSAGAGLQSFTFNAPASTHRGIEVTGDWRFAEGWRLFTAYTFNDQLYTDYRERLSSGAVSKAFDRAGNKIPGVSPNEFLARVGYDQQWGVLKGLGTHVEYQRKDSFFMDNGNSLKAPGYDLINLNVHYNPDVRAGYLQSMSAFFEVRNLLDKTYVASANNIANSLNAGTGAENGASVLANTTGSAYAGMPRTFYGGVKLKF
jgi:iron complex outermembrane recepter protein